MKRRVAVFESMGNSAAAAQALVEYLGLFATDGDAWLQLSRIYLGAAQYQKAAYCYEELLLISPTNHVFHTKYADVSAPRAPPCVRPRAAGSARGPRLNPLPRPSRRRARRSCTPSAAPRSRRRASTTRTRSTSAPTTTRAPSTAC